VATAAFYPTVAIDASGGLSANTLPDLFKASALVWSIGGNAVAPLFRQTLLQHQRNAVIAAHDAASAEFRQTVLQAISDVETALQAGTILERRQAAEDRAVVAARKTLDLSAKRFESGLESFLDVVDAERTRLDAERTANAIRAERLAISVSLFKAIGGEW
jgi:outer membrane protein TolC